VLGVEFTVLSRYEPDGATVIVGGWSRSEAGQPFHVGGRVPLGGRNIHTLVFETRRPARIDDYADASGPAGDFGRALAFGSAVGAPINVGGRLWGMINVASSRDDPLPADTETRLAGFTELVGTALANAEAQSALSASRARIVAAADTARHRFERDLHDGAQQRLVSLALQLRAMQATVPPTAGDLAARLDSLADGLAEALNELREIAHGIHPAALAKGGLRPALGTLARRSTVPVRLDIDVDGRLPEPIELAAYFVVTEALTNAVKHADATGIDVHVTANTGVLEVVVQDDGRGGADVNRGSGLVGLADRVEALGGRISLRSPAGAGTTLEILLPLALRAEPESPAARVGAPTDDRAGDV
jgi:signal transduction histidine kinase